MSADHPTVTNEPELAERACGRCQKLFPRDADEHPTAIPAWWVCPSCREALFNPQSAF